MHTINVNTHGSLQKTIVLWKFSDLLAVMNFICNGLNIATLQSTLKSFVIIFLTTITYFKSLAKKIGKAISNFYLYNTLPTR